MAVESLRVQVTLNASVPIEKAIIDYINNRGKRSGMPKSLMISGFEAITGNVTTNTPLNAPKSQPKPKTKPDLLGIMS